MSSICIIPARGGSKRIPKKNIKDLFGAPIISYVIKEALNSGFFDEVMVSTEDNEIAWIAQKYGASVPFLRSEKTADDYAILADVVVEVMEEYKKINQTFDSICCILPTAALINKEVLKESYSKLINPISSVVPVLKFAYPIQRALKNEEGLLFLRETEHLNTRSQDLETFYHDSGQFYWLRTRSFMEEKKIFTSNTAFIELKEYQAQDVDTLEDWKMLELKYKLTRENGN